MKNSIVFFPFTHMARHQLNAIFAFFGSFTCLSVSSDFKENQSLNELVDKGKIHPLFFAPNEMAALEQKVTQYQEWATLHKGAGHTLKTLLKDTPYFDTRDTSVAGIKSQIKGGKDNPVGGIKTDSSWEKDLLFLKMAQMCDEQNERIDLELKKMDASKATLISSLRGIEIPSDGLKQDQIAAYKDFGEVMTKERILSWSRVMAHKSGLASNGDTPLFVTTSEAIFNYLASNCKDVINALDIDKIKVHENDCAEKSEWQHRFFDCLMRAVKGDGNLENELPKVADQCAVYGRIRLHLFSGNGINKLFKMADKQIPVCLIKLKR